MIKLNRWQNAVFMAGMCLMFVGLVALFKFPEIGKWLYIIGVFMFTPMQLVQRYEGSDFNIKRLRHMQVLSDLLYLLSVVLFLARDTLIMGKYYISNEWMLAIACATVFQLYSAFRMPDESDKQ